MNLADRVLRGPDLLWREYLLQIVERVSLQLTTDQLGRTALVRIADAYGEREAIQLSFGQGVRPMLLDRVLGRHHEVRPREGMRDPLDRHLAFLHRFEQGGLRPGRGPVDLIDQDDVGEHGSRDEAERARDLVEDADTREVGGEEIGCRLDPGEGSSDRYG